MTAARIALIHYAAPPVTGGVEAILGSHRRLLANAGHDVRLIAGRGDAELVPEVDSRHPDVERFFQGLAEGRPDTGLLDDLRRRLTESLAPMLADRDLIIAHNVLTLPMNLALALALVDTGFPLLAWTHDLAWVNPRYSDFHRPGSPYDILHQAQPRTTYVAISRLRQGEIARTMELPEARVPAIFNGIDPADFLGLSEETLDLVRRADVLDHWPVVLVPLRLTRRKRLELAVEAAAHLRSRHPDLRLVISGPLGPHSADNRAYAAELLDLRRRLGVEREVRFLYELAGEGESHPVSDRAIRELYRLSDCVLMPSESEGFGLPALEAGLGRVPLVATDIEVLREVAGPHLHGFPVEAGAETIAEVLAGALATPPAAFRERVLRSYEWASVLRQMESLIEEIRR
ncbi:MAG TPA: glycosyltransferase family 4 protein [Candidatus Dormibacteraeota bacterium]|nr:glycosyltransferase family 4 protein [Candidatus Dormibacteraeota bacterium]